MSRGVKRVLKWTGIVLGSLVILLLVVLWIALKSDRILQWALHRAVAADTTLAIARIHGDLGGPLALGGVRLRTASADITIDSLLFDWSPFGLLRKQVRIDSLHLVGLHVVIPDSTPPSEGPPRKPSLPVGIVMHNTTVRGFTVRAPGGIAVEQGQARISGPADGYEIRASLALSLPQFDSMPQLDTLRIGLVGAGGLTQIHLDTAVVPLLRGRLLATGDVTWWPGISWNLAVAGHELEPGLLTGRPARWPGVLAFRARVKGRKDSTGVYGTVAIDTVTGSLRHQLLSGTGTLRLLGNTPDSTTAIGIPSLSAAWGTARLDLSGYAGDTLSLAFRAGAGRLGTLVNGAAGSLAAQGSLTGSRTAPRVSATARGKQLAWNSDSLARLRLKVDAALAGRGPLDIQLTGSDAVAGPVHLDTVDLTVRGSRTSHRVRLRALGPRTTATLAAAGALEPGGWSGTVDSLRLYDPVLGRWRLSRPAALAVASGADTLSRLCLVSRDSTPAHLCAAGRFASADQWQVTTSLDSFPMALIDSVLPDSMLGTRQGFTGTLSGKLTASARGGRLSARGTLHTAGTAFVYPLSPSDTALQQVVFDTATLALDAGAQGLESTLRLALVAPDRSPVGHLTASLTLPQYHNLHQELMTQPVQLRLTGEMVNLAVTRAFTSRLDSLTGDISLEAQADGTVRAPDIRGQLALTKMTAWLGENRVARGTVNATLAGRIDSTRQLAGSLTVVPRGVIYEYPIAGIKRQVVVDSGALRATADTGMHARLALGFSDINHAPLGTLQATLALPEYRRLGAPLGPEPVDLRLDTDLRQLAILQALTARFDTLQGRLALHATVSGTVATPQIRSTLAVDHLLALLPQGARITGGMEGELRADVAPDSSITGFFRLVPRGLAISGADTSSTARVALADTGVMVRVDSAGLDGNLTLLFADEGGARVGRITGTLRLPQYTRVGPPVAQQPLTARVDGQVQELGFLAGFTAQVDSLDGSARLALRADGTVKHPHASGSLSLDSVSARLPLLGVLYHDLNLTAQADSSGALSLHASLWSDPGQIVITGTSPLHPTVEEPAHLHVQGTGFEAINTPEVHALISPDVNATMAGDSINIQGTLKLPLVAVHLTETPESSVPPSDDVVFVGDSAPPPSSGWRIASRLEIILGDSVTFQGFNFTTELGGRLQLAQSPGRTPTASGELVIQQGHYKAYGQDLTVQNGQVRFAGGPVTNPTLAIEATRTAADSTVAGLRITGTLQNPQVNIFSNPAMAQDRALAYLVTGHAPGEAGGSNGTLVGKAVNAAGLRGGNFLAKSVGSALGLSSAKVQTSGDLQQASFVAGKYLSPDLYVSYAIGLFSPVSTVRIQYQITRHWTLQAERGGTTGADILYKTERGQIGFPGRTGTGSGP